MTDLAMSRRAVTRALVTLPTMIALPALAHAGSDFTVACAEYRRLAALVNAHPYGSTVPGSPEYAAHYDDHAALLNRTMDAFQRVVSMPVTTAPAIAAKLEIILTDYDGCMIDADELEPVLRDLRLLAGAA